MKIIFCEISNILSNLTKHLIKYQAQMEIKERLKIGKNWFKFISMAQISNERKEIETRKYSSSS